MIGVHTGWIFIVWSIMAWYTTVVSLQKGMKLLYNGVGGNFRAPDYKG
jgi:hypothetical protein